MRVGILPASGLATRMSGLPKFMLPYDVGPVSIIQHHVMMMACHVDRVVVTTRSEWFSWLEQNLVEPKIEIQVIESNSLTETILRGVKGLDLEELVVGLPDVAIVGENPYGLTLDHASGPLVTLGAFKTAEVDRGKFGSLQLLPSGIVGNYADKDPQLEWGFHWGTLLIQREALGMISSKWPTIGELVGEMLRKNLPVAYELLNSLYFDCGTVEGYFRYVRDGWLLPSD